MPKINQEEYEKIKLLPDYDWNWIAREKTGKILSFTNKPTKTDEVWKDKQTRLWFNYKDSQLFQFIQWEDEEPYNIAELIDEYDRRGGKMMKKDIEWVKNRIKNTLKFEALNDREIGFKVAMEEVLGIIDQLDEPEVTLNRAFEKVSEIYPMTKEEVCRHLEQVVAHGGKVTYGEPEVLSQEWIDSNSINASHDGVTDEYVHVDDLENLLVPEQEELESKIKVLIEAYKQEDGAYSNPENGWISGFVEDLENLVEEEPKYVIKLPMSTSRDVDFALVDHTGDIWVDAYPSKYKLTEQEILSLPKGDVYFKYFAEPVEELEE